MTKNIFKYISFCFLLGFTSCRQSNRQSNIHNPDIKYDEKLISNDSTTINFFSTNKRGIKVNDIVYFVSADKQILTAFDQDNIIWQTNVIEICGPPDVGPPEIYEIHYDDNFWSNDIIYVQFGQHDQATVNPRTGETEFWGSD